MLLEEFICKIHFQLPLFALTLFRQKQPWVSSKSFLQMNAFLFEILRFHHLIPMRYFRMRIKAGWWKPNYCSLFRRQASGGLTPHLHSLSLKWECLLHFLLTCYLSRSHLYLASLEKASPNLISQAFAIYGNLYRHRWITWMEMDPDRQCSIWFPNKLHRPTEIFYFAECINCVFSCNQTCQSKGNIVYGVWWNMLNMQKWI